MVAYVTLFFGRGGELQIAVFCVGHVIDMAVNHALKHTVKAVRPEGGFCANSGYASPSHHTQFMAFFAGYCSVFLLKRVRMPALYKGVLVFGFVLWAAIVGYSRWVLACYDYVYVVRSLLRT